jgi:hypothetical protein
MHSRVKGNDVAVKVWSCAARTRPSRGKNLLIAFNMAIGFFLANRP